MSTVQDAMHRAEESVEISWVDLPDIAKRMAAEWPTPGNYLPKLKEQITAIIVARGYPEPGISVFHKGRQWRAFEAGDRPQRGEAISPGWAFTQRNSELLTPEHEAAGIFFNIVEVEAALEAADIAHVFAHALRLGFAVERFNLRRRHLKAVKRGVQVAENLRSAGLQTNALHGGRRKARFARMAELVPVMGVDKAAAQCAFEELGSMEAIKRQWNRHKKKRDT